MSLLKIRHIDINQQELGKKIPEKGKPKGQNQDELNWSPNTICILARSRESSEARLLGVIASRLYLMPYLTNGGNQIRISEGKPESTLHSPPRFCFGFVVFF